MKFGLLLTACLLPLSILASIADAGPNPIKRTIECQILDASTGEALTGVQVSIAGCNVATWTDEEGKFSIELAPDHNSTLTCSLVSFETISLELTDLQNGAVLYLNEK
jgi:hypothetical protein